MVSAVERYTNKLFWELNDKYQLGFDKALAIKKSQAGPEKIFSTLETSANLYTPLFIFGPNDLDWEHGRVRKSSLLLGANLIASQASIFYKFKSEGKIYYGRDIRPHINSGFTWWERLKGILIPQHLAVFALLISPFFPNRSVKYNT